MGIDAAPLPDKVNFPVQGIHDSDTTLEQLDAVKGVCRLPLTKMLESVSFEISLRGSVPSCSSMRGN